jgi:leucyl/phenylalanyl-tRNA--protein transferase
MAALYGRKRATTRRCGEEYAAIRLVVKTQNSVPILNQGSRFPDPRRADAQGLVAIGGELSVDRLLEAYRMGIFPWTVAPVTWWSPDPRAIFELGGFHLSRSLARVIRKRVFRITLDRAFRHVMEACAAPAPGRRTTWISPEFIAAYTELHEQGHAHSVECWQDTQLLGGIYGVTLGGLFAGESMFHRADNASKVALFHLIEHLRRQKFVLFDIQMLTPITSRLGGIEIPRDEYLQRLAKAVEKRSSF